MSGKRGSDHTNGDRNNTSDRHSWIGGSDWRSQSNVIGVLLIVGVVLVLAASAAFFVTDIGANDDDGPVFVDISTEVATDGVAITHESGDTIPVEELTLVVDTGVQRAETSFADIESSIDSFSAGDRAVAELNDLEFTDTDTAEQLAAGTNVQVIHDPSNTVLVDKSNVQASGDTTIEGFSVDLNLNTGSGSPGTNVNSQSASTQSVGTLSQSDSPKDELEANYRFEAGDVLGTVLGPEESLSGTVTFSGNLLDEQSNSLTSFSKSSDFELTPGDTVDNTLQWGVPIEYATDAYGFDVRLNVSVNEADIGVNESVDLDVEPAEIRDISIDEDSVRGGGAVPLEFDVDVENDGDLTAPDREVEVDIEDDQGDSTTVTKTVNPSPGEDTVPVTSDQSTDDDDKSYTVKATIDGEEVEEKDNDSAEIPLAAFGEVAFEGTVFTVVDSNLEINASQVLRTGGTVTVVLEHNGDQTTEEIDLGVDDPSNEIGTETTSIPRSRIDDNLDVTEPVSVTLFKSDAQEVGLSEAQVSLAPQTGEVLNADERKVYSATDPNTIQSAVDEARETETLLLGPGTYEETVTINTKDLALEAAPGASPTVDGQGEIPVLVNKKGVTVDDENIEFLSGIDVGADISAYPEQDPANFDFAVFDDPADLDGTKFEGEVGSTAFETIDAAAAEVGTNDRVLVFPGEYDFTAVNNDGNGTKEGLEYVSYAGPADTKITDLNEVGPNPPEGVTLIRDGMVLQGFTFVSSELAPQQMVVINGDNAEFSHNIIEEGVTVGNNLILIDGGEGIIFDNNEIRDSAGEDFSMSVTGEISQVKNIEIRNNLFTGDISEAHIALSNTDSPVVEDNTLRNSRIGIQLINGYGSVNSAKINRNLIESSADVVENHNTISELNNNHLVSSNLAILRYEGASGNLKADNNWFGTEKTDDIQTNAFQPAVPPVIDPFAGAPIDPDAGEE